MQPLQFHNGNFKIMQIADIQEIADFSPDTESLLRCALIREKPDLAILTGDQIKGYGVTMHTGDARARAEAVIGKIRAIFDDYQVPFAVLFGNHDVFREVSKEEQLAMYQKSPYCVGESVTGLTGYGIYHFPIIGSDGKVVFSIYGFDSMGYAKGTGGYHSLPADQIDWYRKNRDALAEQEGHLVPAIVFQHIPVPEVYELMDEVPKGTKGALRGACAYGDRYYVLGSKVFPGGFMKENAAIPSDNSGEFDALCEKGDVMALFFGHDHINSFSGLLRGVEVGYTQGCGFNVYGPGVERGVRVFDIPEDNPRAYTHHTLTYRQLIGNTPQRAAKNLLYTYAPSSVSVALDWAKKAGAVAAVAGVGMGTLAVLAKKMKK